MLLGPIAVPWTEGKQRRDAHGDQVGTFDGPQQLHHFSGVCGGFAIGAALSCTAAGPRNLRYAAEWVPVEQAAELEILAQHVEAPVPAKAL